MIVIEKNTERIDIPNGLGMVSLGKGGITPEEAREIAQEEVESALTDYDTSEVVDGKIEALESQIEGEIDAAIEAETARTESTYAKVGDIPSLEGYAKEEYVNNALTAYTPTANFATINGSGITEGGNIVIEGGGGDSNYLIVNDLSEIEEPYDGLCAYVKEKYEDISGVYFHAGSRASEYWEYDCGYVFGRNENQMNIHYYAGSEQWNWGEYDDGEFHKGIDGGVGVQWGWIRKTTDNNFEIYITNSNYSLEYYTDKEDAYITGSTVSTFKTAEGKSYIYKEAYGWIENPIVIEEGDASYAYSATTKMIVEMLKNHIYPNLIIYFNRKYIPIICYGDVDNSGHCYMSGIYGQNDRLSKYIFSINSDYRINRNWESNIHTGNEGFVYMGTGQGEEGERGGDWLHYEYFIKNGYKDEGERGRYLSGTFNNGWKLQIELARWQGWEDGRSIQAQIFDTDDQLRWDEGFEYGVTRDFNIDGVTGTLKFECEDVEGVWHCHIRANFIDALAPEGNLIDTIANNYISLTNHGVEHTQTIPSKLMNSRNDKEAILYNKADIQEFAKEECVENVQNVSGIWRGTQAQYNALTPVDSVLYIIVG